MWAGLFGRRTQAKLTMNPNRQTNIQFTNNVVAGGTMSGQGLDRRRGSVSPPTAMTPHTTSVGMTARHSPRTPPPRPTASAHTIDATNITTAAAKLNESGFAPPGSGHRHIRLRRARQMLLSLQTSQRCCTRPSSSMNSPMHNGTSPLSISCWECCRRLSNEGGSTDGPLGVASMFPAAQRTSRHGRRQCVRTGTFLMFVLVATAAFL